MASERQKEIKRRRKRREKRPRAPVRGPDAQAQALLTSRRRLPGMSGFGVFERESRFSRSSGAERGQPGARIW